MHRPSPLRMPATPLATLVALLLALLLATSGGCLGGPQGIHSGLQVVADPPPLAAGEWLSGTMLPGGGEFTLEVRLGPASRGRLVLGLPSVETLPGNDMAAPPAVQLGFSGSAAGDVAGAARIAEADLPSDSPWWPGYWNRLRFAPTSPGGGTALWVNGVRYAEIARNLGGGFAVQGLGETDPFEVRAIHFGLR